MPALQEGQYQPSEVASGDWPAGGANVGIALLGLADLSAIVSVIRDPAAEASRQPEPDFQFDQIVGW